MSEPAVVDPRLRKFVDSGHVVLVDGAPVAQVACRGCGAVAHYPLLHEGELVLSPLRWVLNGDECEACAAKHAEEQAGRDFERRLIESGIPRALAGEVSWESIIVASGSPDDQVRRERALELARGWAVDRSPAAKGVWLHGSQGSGKTRLIATAAVERLRHTPVRWVSVAVLITQLDGAWNDDDRKAALKVLTDPGCVVLDDLDKVVPTDRVRNALFTALETREQSKVGIAVTSNEAPGKVAEMFSSPFMSRLVSMATPLAYPGPDRRLRVVEG